MSPSLFGEVGGRSRPKSRIHSPARVLRELRRLAIKAARAQARDLTADEHIWLARVGCGLAALIREGDAAVSSLPDPRGRLLARKRGAA